MTIINLLFLGRWVDVSFSEFEMLPEITKAYKVFYFFSPCQFDLHKVWCTITHGRGLPEDVSYFEYWNLYGNFNSEKQKQIKYFEFSVISVFQYSTFKII